MTFSEYLKNLNINYNDNPDNPQGNQVSGDQSHKLPVFDTENLDNLDYNKLPALQKNSILDQEPSESTQETPLGTTSTNSERVEQEASPTEEMSTFEKVLNAFLSFGKIREKVEKECNGDVADYLKEVAARDGNANDLTIDDFEKELKEEGVDINEAIQNATGSSAATETNVPEEVAEVTTTEPETSNIQETIQSVDTPILQSPPTPSRSNRPRGYGMTGSKRIQPNPLWSMSLDELKAEKETRTATLKEKQQAVNDIHSGKNEKVKAANEQLDKARDEYSKALDEDPNMKKYKKEIEKQLEQEKKLNIAASENEISINNKTIEIAEKENVILDLEANIAASESKLSSLKISGREEDKEKDEQVKRQKKELEKSINEAKKQLKDEKKNLEKLNNELDKLNDAKEKIQKQIEENKKALAESQELVNTYANDTTKAKMEAYNEAVENVAQVKEAELKIATQELQKAQGAVTEVDAAITAAKYKDTNSVVEQAIAIARRELAKGVHEATGHNDGKAIKTYARGREGLAWCAYFVSYCYADGQGRDNADTFKYQGGVANITAQARKAGYYSNGVNYTPKPGDLISYKTHSHIGIVDEVLPDGSYYTIEGNTSNAVRRVYHKANSSNANFVRMSDWLERA